MTPSEKILADFETALGVVQRAFEPETTELSPICRGCKVECDELDEDGHCYVCAVESARDDQADMETERILEEKAGII